MTKQRGLILLALFCMLQPLLAQTPAETMEANRQLVEKIHVHFDRNVYSRGESVWYKVYLLHNGSDTAISSRNVYLDFYQEDGSLLKHTVAPVSLAAAEGMFDIPADYKGKLIHVKAYTRWMLNDEPDFRFSRELFITHKSGDAARPPMLRTDVHVFPEGGSLVQGLSSRVAFKAADQFGHPVAIDGELIDESGTVLETLTTQHDGMGLFALKPQGGKSYKLRWKDGLGTTGSIPLPAVLPEGANLAVFLNKDQARFIIERTTNAPAAFRQMNLLVHMNEVTVYKIALNVSEKTTLRAEVPVGELPSGVLQFSLFTSDWKPIAERVVLVNNQTHSFPINIHTPLLSFEKRGKNEIVIEVPDTLLTNMSLSITDAAMQEFDDRSIFSDILLSSEIKGKVHNPAYYFSSNEDSIAAHLDLVMLTHGWRKYNWEMVRKAPPGQPKFPMERDYMSFSGKVIGKSAGQPESLQVIMVAKDSSQQALSVPLASDGRFKYEQIVYDTVRLYYSMQGKSKAARNAQLQVETGLLTTAPETKLTTAPGMADGRLTQEHLGILFAQQERLRKLMTEATLDEVVVHTVAKSREDQLTEKYASTFFARARSTTFDLTDESKIVFAGNTLEYLQSRVAGLNILPDPGQMNAYRVAWRGETPVYFVDERPVDVSELIAVPVVNIALIKAYPPVFIYAPGGGRGGAIAIYTKRGGDYNPPSADTKGLASAMLAGYTSFREFYSPDYDQPSSEFSKPDNRITLYWDPYVMTNAQQRTKKISFFNNDFTKAFYIVLEGINAEGRMTRVVKKVGGS